MGETDYFAFSTHTHGGPFSACLSIYLSIYLFIAIYLYLYICIYLY